MESHNCAGDHSHRHLPSPHTDNAPPPPPEASNMDVETPDHVHSESRMDCPVCLSNAPQQAPSLASVLLKCGHRNWLIHNECIVPWLSRSRTPTCPLCRCVTRASRRLKTITCQCITLLHRRIDLSPCFHRRIEVGGPSFSALRVQVDSPSVSIRRNSLAHNTFLALPIASLHPHSTFALLLVTSLHPHNTL